MNCKDIENKLIFYIEKTLSDNEMSAIAEHLEHCKNCKAKFDFLSENLSIIETEKQQKANPFIGNIITSKIRHQTGKTAQIIRILQPVAVAAMLVFAILLGQLTGKLYNSTKNNNNFAQTYQQDIATEYAMSDIPYNDYYFVEAQ